MKRFSWSGRRREQGNTARKLMDELIFSSRTGLGIRKSSDETNHDGIVGATEKDGAGHDLHYWQFPRRS
jgi:hypothetical protein